MTYLYQDGTFSDDSGKIEDQFPSLVYNSKLGMRHSLTEGPLFAIRPPVRVESFRELLVMPAPETSNDDKGQRMLCPANSFYPVARMEAPDSAERDFERRKLHVQGQQQARGAASKQNERNRHVGILALAAGVAVAISTVLFALIALATWWDSRTTETTPTEVEQTDGSPWDKTIFRIDWDI